MEGGEERKGVGVCKDGRERTCEAGRKEGGGGGGV